MSESEPLSFIGLPELQDALRAAEPAVLLVPAWLLEAVIAFDLELGPRSFVVPDPQLHIIGRDRLLRYIEEKEFPVPEDLPDTLDLVLLERPDADRLAGAPAERVLLHYWRLLTRTRAEGEFRYRIEAEVGHPVGLVPVAETTPALHAAVQRRFQRIGADTFNEARFVLLSERRIHADAPDHLAYAKFLAMFLDLRHFAPHRLPHVFPSIVDIDHVAELLEADIEPDLVERIRPEGARLPDDEVDGPDEQDDDSDSPDRTRPDEQERRRRERWVERAEQASEAGNDVKAAIFHSRAFASPERERSERPHPRALRDLESLTRRLTAALHAEESAAETWQTALRPLLMPAARGWWGPERRLLYDLQKACVDVEREIYSVSVVDWILDLGRRPLRRAVPLQGITLVYRHLQSAERRLAKCRIDAAVRSRLAALLHEAVHHAEHNVREALRPGIARSLDASGLCPANTVEITAREKLAAELTDVVLRDGSASMGSLRDAVSRNLMKCEDLRSPLELVKRDQLLRIDRELSRHLDGVYRRGEIYRRWFQKLSALLFGNPTGRFLTRTLILPLSAAFIILAGLDHTVLHAVPLLGGPHVRLSPELGSHKPPPDALLPEHVHVPHGPQTLQWFLLISLAILLVCLINSSTARAIAARAAKGFVRGLRFILIDLPAVVVDAPIVQALVRSRLVQLAWRYLFKPMLVVVPVWLLLPDDMSPRTRAGILAGTFFVLSLAMNSRSGRAIEHAVLHALRVGWSKFVADVLIGFVSAIMRFFGRMLEAVDRMLYAVDEYLRFRTGQKGRTVFFKAAAGVVWFFIAYFFRFVINLLVEPQINPIKHFPVVTVSHKLILPMALPSKTAPSPIGSLLMSILPLSRTAADTTAGSIVWLIPGIFGFLAWELKENWKLYRANRPKHLKPVHFGSHGESIAQLLRPGLHSGTLPKTYAKLRKAYRKLDTLQTPAAEAEASAEASIHKQLDAITHVREAVEHFLERAWINLLNRHPAFESHPIRLQSVRLGATRIGLELGCDLAADQPLRIAFEQRSGWIVAGVDDHGWTTKLDAPAAEVLQAAMEGLYTMAAVDIVREQVEAAMGVGPVELTFTPREMIVCPADRPLVQARYDLTCRRIAPTFAGVEVDDRLPTLDARQILHWQSPMAWDRWVLLWQEPMLSGPANGRAVQDLRRTVEVGAT